MLITESRLEKIVTNYLDDIYVPDYGWVNSDFYQKEIERFGDLIFYVEDIESYYYYGNNSNSLSNDITFEGYELPLLEIYPHIAERLTMMFGDIWEPIFKKWFEEHTGLNVVQLTTDKI